MVKNDIDVNTEKSMYNLGICTIMLNFDGKVHCITISGVSVRPGCTGTVFTCPFVSRTTSVGHSVAMVPFPGLLLFNGFVGVSDPLMTEAAPL